MIERKKALIEDIDGGGCRRQGGGRTSGSVFPMRLQGTNESNLLRSPMAVGGSVANHRNRLTYMHGTSVWYKVASGRADRTLLLIVSGDKQMVWLTAKPGIFGTSGITTDSRSRYTRCFKSNGTGNGIALATESALLVGTLEGRSSTCILYLRQCCNERIKTGRGTWRHPRK